jgi:nitrite reductase/ring-hydroxylating ferredoxin subunit
MDSDAQAYDDAMFEFSQGSYENAIRMLQSILASCPDHFDAQLSLGMAYCRMGNFAKAIEEGHKAEKMRPNEQLVHTNLSLFYMRSGDKKTAEHHGLQARISSWKGNMAPPPAAGAGGPVDQGLQMAPAAQQPMRPPAKFPEMPWKNQKRLGAEPPAAPVPVPEAGDIWHRVESAKELAPGSGKSFLVRGREVAIYRVGDQFFALDDRCSHREASLGAGYQEMGHVFCPMHGWKFELATGACVTNPERPVRSHAVELRQGEVWVRISK